MNRNRESMISASAMDENQFITINAYYAEPEKIFSVPANYSLDEIQAAIRSEMGGTTLTFEPPSLASGEFFNITDGEQIMKCLKTQALPLGKLQRKMGQSTRSST